jgi:hypothetical protein
MCLPRNPGHRSTEHVFFRDVGTGVDIAKVQKMMGYADPATTARYNRRGEEAQKKPTSLLRFPYARGG